MYIRFRRSRYIRASFFFFFNYYLKKKKNIRVLLYSSSSGELSLSRLVGIAIMQPMP